MEDNTKHFSEPVKAKVFMNGRSQAVRLPKDFRFDDSEVLIYKVGDKVVLMPIQKSWDTFFQDKACLTEDFLQDRLDSQPEIRELF